ncbi:MAG: acetylornithine deacetylase [Rhodobacteraceae bacterium]|nr:acetylornithine deacetylase [Paracoccaceae bacterium]
MTNRISGHSDARGLSAVDILAELVAIDVLPGHANTRMVDWISTYLSGLGVPVETLPGPDAGRSNLFATIGPRDKAGYILSGHMDVVPVEGQPWTSNPFKLTQTDGRLVGRGTSDMKGFLACVLASVPLFQSSGLSRPIHLAFSYDEEIGCRGVPHMIEKLPDLCTSPLGCLVGEPTGLKPVLAHKGKQARSFVFQGKSAHSSTPGLGENAIYPAADLITHARKLALGLAETGPRDDRFDPPFTTVVAGVVSGGSAVNIIPENCVVDIEVRTVPGVDAGGVMKILVEQQIEMGRAAKEEGRSLGVSSQLLSSYPALAPTENTELIALAEQLSGSAAVQSVSYGTEAGLFAGAGIDTVICGPGDMSRAHKADEFVLAEELDSCTAMLAGLAAELSSS